MSWKSLQIVPIGNMANGVSNGHVTDNVTWPWKVKLVTPIRLKPNILKTAGDIDSVPGLPIGNGIWGITWSRDRWRHVIPKGDVSTVGYPTTAWLLVSKAAGLEAFGLAHYCSAMLCNLCYDAFTPAVKMANGASPEHQINW